MSTKPDPKDRLLDTALAELLGGDTPSDLTAAILAKHEAPPAVRKPGRASAPLQRALFCAAAGLFLFAVGVLAYVSTPNHNRELATAATALSEERFEELVTDLRQRPGHEISGEPANSLASILSERDSLESLRFKDDALYEKMRSPSVQVTLDISDAPAQGNGALVLNSKLPAEHKRPTVYTVQPPVTLYKEAAQQGQQQATTTLGANHLYFSGSAINRGFGWHSGFDDVEGRRDGGGFGGAAFGRGEGPGRGGDQYERVVENPFRIPVGQDYSTFSIDVDTASYTNVRQMIGSQRLPPPDAVRIEELVNYFSFDYQPPARVDADADPFAVHMEVAACPWQPKHRLLRIGLKGREVPHQERPRSNLVFLVDVSGSMSDHNKLPLVTKGLARLAEHLGENDRVAVVVYANAEGLALDSTPGSRREEIIAALENLRAGGSTNGGAGIELAYSVAHEHFIEGGTNRVILCTDGDFNVGTTSSAALERLVQGEAQAGVFLTVLGFGRGNLNDAMMERISNIGNGNYFYIDRLREAEKVLVEQMGGTLVTIAKDVKVQMDFNTDRVAAYRLIGYENRVMHAQDFNDDTKDAGEIGAGHTVTALYEIVPVGEEVKAPNIEPSRYGAKPNNNDAQNDELQVHREICTLRLRYKQPDGDQSTLRKFPLLDNGKAFADASRDTKFAAAVAMFGMLLRGSDHAGMSTYAAAAEIAQANLGEDANGYRKEFVELVNAAGRIAGERRPPSRGTPDDGRIGQF